MVTSLFFRHRIKEGEGNAEKRGKEERKDGDILFYGLGFASGGSGWMAGSGVISPFQVSSPLPPHPGLGEDIQSISEADGRRWLPDPAPALSPWHLGRSPDPFRDVRLTSLSPLSGCLACPVSCTRNGSERVYASQVVTAEGIWIVSYTRKGERGGEEKKFLFRIGGRKSPKNGSVRDLTLWFRIKDGEQRGDR